MKADVVLRLCPDRATFGVFFTYSNASLRTLLVTAGVCYEAAARRFLLPATSAAVAELRRVCEAKHISLDVPIVSALAGPPPPPTPADELLSRYCQGLALRRYSPNTLKNYRGAFLQFLGHTAPRLPLELTRQEVLDYMAMRVEEGISEAY